MVIAINIADYLGRDIHTSFLLQAAKSIAISCSEHTVVIIHSDDFSLPKDSHLQGYSIKVPSRRQLFSWAIYQLRLTRALKNANVSTVITPFVVGRSYTKASQVFVDTIPVGASMPAGVKTFYRSYYKKFIIGAKGVIYPSGYAAKKMIAEAAPGVPVNTLSSLFLADAPVVSGELREDIKNRYAAGQEYFLLPYLPATVEDIVSVLKSFSAFKKRQKSGMKLCLATTLSERMEKGKALVRSYKYREDVVFMLADSDKVMTELCLAAYAIIDNAATDVFRGAANSSFAAGVPLLMPDTDHNKKIFGDAAIYYDEEKEGSLGIWMMEVYKNEYLRKQVSQSARELYLSLHEDSILQLAGLFR